MDGYSTTSLPRHIHPKKKATELVLSLEILIEVPKEGRKKTEKYSKQNEKNKL